MILGAPLISCFADPMEHLISQMAGLHTQAVPPPVQPGWDPHWDVEGYITWEYIQPEEGTWHLDELECFQVENLLDAEITRHWTILHDSRLSAVSRHRRLIESFPKLVWEWSFWRERGVGSNELDGRMDALVTEMLRVLHGDDPYQGRRLEVRWLLPCARAIRERLFPHLVGHPCSDEYP